MGCRVAPSNSISVVATRVRRAALQRLSGPTTGAFAARPRTGNLSCTAAARPSRSVSAVTAAAAAAAAGNNEINPAPDFISAAAPSALR